MLLSMLLIASTGPASQSPSPASIPPDANGYVGNEACAKCHAAIFESYQRTAMAHASGPATDNPITGDFLHKKSGVNYRIYTQDRKVWLSFERPGDPSVRGKRELLYYIGQGRRGRTYLFSVDGFLFESPVNWYTDKHMWDMAPAYGNVREAPMNLPALTSCLDCHVSGIQPPIQGTENRYTMPVFAYSGVTCERCHGPGAAHANGGTIVNPAKLAADRRDAVCMQCHLEGNAAIERPGKHLYEFRPGDDLSAYIRYYLRADERQSSLRAASQFEALAQSVCKKKSGAAMSCMSCHDPHRPPSAEERVSFYREKCMACHAGLSTKHHANQPDCTSCHMPANLSTDVAHTAVTDHRIQRRPNTGPVLEDAATRPSPPLPRLAPFPDSTEAEHDNRDMALAWASMAENGDAAVIKQAEQLLRKAVAESPKDAALLSSLGYVEQRRGAIDDARELYQRALAQDPSLLDAATNLGVIEANSGHLREAVTLWEGAFERAPGRSSIGMNIARAFCSAGQLDRVRDVTMRVLQFNPDLDSAKKLLNGLNGTPAKCGM
ncbi:MAG TPA: multiheme c-type cytochrome [Terriglobales bacterium]|nr:multiheme c-type cytochrome [Terriglobales bacterium]